MAALERPSQHICVLFFLFVLFSHHSTFCQSEYLRESHSFEDTQRQPIQTWTSGFKLRSFRKRLKFHSFKTSTRKNCTQNSSPGFLFYFLLFLIFNFAVFENMDMAVDVFHKFVSLFLTVCRSLSAVLPRPEVPPKVVATSHSVGLAHTHLQLSPPSPPTLCHSW